MAYTYFKYEGDGKTITFAIPFALGYLKAADISVRVGNEVDSLGKPQYRTWSFVPGNDGMIQIDGPVPQVGETIAIARTVDKTKLVHDFQKGEPLDEQSLDESHKQLMMAAQEVFDGRGGLSIVDLDMQGNVIRNVGIDKTDPTSAINYGLYQELEQKMDDSYVNADRAETAAANAEASENAAAESARQAKLSEQAAKASENAAASSEDVASAAAASAAEDSAATADDRIHVDAVADEIKNLTADVTTLDPGQPASANYNAETGVLELGIPKGQPGDAAIATPTSLGVVMPQTGNEDGLVLGTDGTLRVRAASATQRGSVKLNDTVTSTSTTQGATANAVKTAYDKAVEAESAIANAFFVGELRPSFASRMSGFLLCNGATVSRTTYADLFAVLGTAFGAGNGSTTFNLPDFRDKTFWGANGKLKKVIAAGLPNITGNLQGAGIDENYDSHSMFNVVTGAFYIGNPGGDTETLHKGGINAKAWYHKFDASRSNSIYNNSTTVQPPAIGVNIFIKY